MSDINNGLMKVDQTILLQDRELQISKGKYLKRVQYILTAEITKIYTSINNLYTLK